MNNPYPYYYSLKNKECYFMGDVPPCVVCQDIPHAMLWTLYNNMPRCKSERIEIYCGNCLYIASKRLKIYNKYCDRQLTAINNFIIVETLPPQVIPYNIIPNNQLARSNEYDTFTLAHTNVEHELVIDKTVHAGRESWQGASIGIPYKEENKQLNISDVKEYLLDVKKSNEHNDK